MSDRTKEILLSAGVWLSRIIVGGAFIFSGFSKAVDPWGSIFKFEQYLSTWGQSQPRSLILTFAVILSMIEFMLGIAVLTGIFRRKAPWLVLAMMAFFLPLTAYIAIASPVDDCGCFGDAWIISNNATFIKNIVLTALTVYLIYFNSRVVGIFTEAFQWLVAVAAGFYILFVAMIGYNIQPLVDFRAFPEGTSLLNEENDGWNTTLIYEKDGLKEEFPLENLPSDNSGWKYIGRKDQGRETHPFVIENDEGENLTDVIIPDEGEILMLVIPEASRADLANTMYINRIHKVLSDKNIEMIAVLGDATPEDEERWQDLSMAEYPIFTAESTQLKSLARGNMSFVLLEDGRVKDKISLSILSMGDMEELEKGNKSIEDLVSFDQHKTLLWLNRTFFLVLLVLFLLSLPHRYYRFLKRRKKVSTEG